MTTCWTFALPKVAEMMGYPEHLADTMTLHEVSNVIRLHHAKVKRQAWTPLPY